MKWEMGSRKWEVFWCVALLLMVGTSAAGQRDTAFILQKIETKTFSLKNNDKIFNLPDQLYYYSMADPMLPLDIVIVSSPPIPVTFNTPAPVMKLYPKDLRREDNLSIAPALNRIPGVFMQSGTLSTNRISIRGIGSRSLFTTAKIRAYLDEIPITNGVGETSLEDIDLSLLSEVEIYKGPTASVYGAGLGGLIRLKSLNNDPD